MFCAETYNERLGTQVCWREEKPPPHAEQAVMHRLGQRVVGPMRVVDGAIPRPRIQEGRRRVWVLDGRGVLDGRCDTASAEDDLAEQALWV